MECQRLRAARHTLCIAALLCAVYPPPLFSQAASPPVPAPFEITTTPSMGAPGETRELTIQPADVKNCPNPLPNLTLVAPQGNGIKVLSQQPVQAHCLIIADIAIAKNAAPNSTVMLRLEGQTHQIFGEPFPFSIAVPVTPPGPIPPGMKPTLDVMWGVVPDEVVHDDFGHYISNKFFCVEVVIGNDTGYPVQISAVGFKMNSSLDTPIPSSGYRTARAMLEVGQLENARGYVIAALGTAGAIGTGALPFFHNVGHKANFATWVNIVSNPLQKGFELLVPDLTVAELNRLDDQVLRDNVVIPNNTQVRTVVLIPKAVVLPFLKSATDRPAQENKGGVRSGPPGSSQPQTGSAPGENSADSGDNSTECAWPGGLRHMFTCRNRTSTRIVMNSLGTLEVIGKEIAYINRVQVNSAPNAPSVSLSPSSLAFTSLTNAPQKVVLTNTGTAPLSISKIDPATGTSADDFSQSNDCPTALAPGAACTITITFTAAAEGKHQATLSVSDDAANSPQSVSLTANWSSTITAPSLNLPDKSPHDLTLTNTATTSLTIQSISPTGNNANDFTMGDNKCLKALGAGTPCDTSVQFTGSGSSEQTILDIRDDKGNLVGLVNITGPK